VGTSQAPTPPTTTAGTDSFYVSQTLNGCEGTRALITVTIKAAPPAPTVSNPVLYCQGSPATPLNPRGPGLKWYLNPTGGVGLPAVTPITLLPGIFRFYVSETANGCEGPRAEVQVQVLPNFSLGPNREVRVCNGNFFNLGNVIGNLGLPVSFFFNGVSVTRPDSLTLPGDYQIVVGAGTSCADTLTVSLIVQPPVVAFAGNDTTAIPGQPIQLNASGGGLGGSYQWTDLGPSFTAQFSNPLIANPTVIIQEPLDSLRVEVTDAAGCRGSAVIRITTTIAPAIYIPTAFSPNGDGLNDLFRPTLVGYGGLRLFRVFNRFGEVVFETNRSMDGWDGTYKVKAKTTGNYVWILKAT